MKPAQAAVLDGIVRSAATAFGELGYRAATLDAIAERAGLSKVTLYRYVSSKEDLLSLVVERTIDEFQQGLRRIIAERRPADDTLRRIVRYQVTLLAEHLPFLTVFFSEESGLPAPMAARSARAKREYDQAIERVVREGIEAGLLPRSAAQPRRVRPARHVQLAPQVVPAGRQAERRRRSPTCSWRCSSAAIWPRAAAGGERADATLARIEARLGRLEAAVSARPVRRTRRR